MKTINILTEEDRIQHGLTSVLCGRKESYLCNRENNGYNVVVTWFFVTFGGKWIIYQTPL
jgi:hypothetical protein